MSRGERIRRYRKMKGLTQKSLAERIGLAESAVRNYELGLRDPSQETLAALSDALGVPMSALDDYELSSAREALEALFRLEDAFGLKPVDGETLALDPKAECRPRGMEGRARRAGGRGDDPGRVRALEGDLRIARQRTLLGRSLMAAFVPPFSLP